MSVAVVLAVGLAWLEVGGRRITVTAIVLFSILAGLFALGYRLALKVRDLLEIDVAQRLYLLTRDFSPAGSGPLDELGPLQVEKRTRRVGDRGSTITQYVVHGQAHAAVDLYVETTAGKARRRMEELAKAWRLPSRSLGGGVRGPDELDVPLHDRLRDDRKAREPVELRPEWGVTIEPLSLGWAIRSRHRAWTPFAISLAMAAGVGFFISRLAATDIFSSVLRRDDPFARVLLGIFGLVGLLVLWLVLQGVRDTFFPGTVLVTDRGVRYRFSRMSLREIEEVTTQFPIELVGDRRSLALGATFCPAVATDAVAHELQRLIIEVAETYPHARAAS
jgi:hypothetical protein